MLMADIHNYHHPRPVLLSMYVFQVL